MRTSTVKRRIQYIDAIKGISGIWVTFFHYVLAFFPIGYVGWGSGVGDSDRAARFFSAFPVSAFTNSSFPLYTFFALISFTLAAAYFGGGSGESVKRQAVKRYFRLMPPVLACTMICYALLACRADVQRETRGARAVGVVVGILREWGVLFVRPRFGALYCVCLWRRLLLQHTLVYERHFYRFIFELRDIASLRLGSRKVAFLRGDFRAVRRGCGRLRGVCRGHRGRGRGGFLPAPQRCSRFGAGSHIFGAFGRSLLPAGMVAVGHSGGRLVFCGELCPSSWALR